MRKLLIASGIVLLVAASAQATFVVSLVDHQTGLNSFGWLPGTYTIDVVIDNPGETLGMIGGGGEVVTSAGITASNLVLNTVDFDSDLTTMNTTDPNEHFEIMTFGKGPYNAPISIASFTLTVTSAARFYQNVTLINAIIGTEDFATQGAVVGPAIFTPEPATALLLMGALPFLRRRQA